MWNDHQVGVRERFVAIGSNKNGILFEEFCASVVVSLYIIAFFSFSYVSRLRNLNVLPEPTRRKLSFYLWEKLA